MKINSLTPVQPKETALFAAENYIKINSLWQGAQASLAEALDNLTKVDARNELKITTSEQVSLVDWLNSHFGNLMQEHASATGLSVAVCASLWHKQLVELIFPTLVALRFQYHLVPSFDGTSILLDIEENGRINTLSIANNAFASDDEFELDEKLKIQIMQFGQSLEPIFAEQKVNRRRFWGNLSNALIQGFTRISEKKAVTENVSEIINAWVERVLTTPNTLVKVKSVGTSNQHYLYARRDVCCLKYKLNKDRMCKTCNLFDETEQEAFYQKKYL